MEEGSATRRGICDCIDGLSTNDLSCIWNTSGPPMSSLSWPPRSEGHASTRVDYESLSKATLMDKVAGNPRPRVLRLVEHPDGSRSPAGCEI